MELSVAIPNSFLSDESTKMNKTKKIFYIARACSIFHINTIFIYDENERYVDDGRLMNMILKYLIMPPFFRKTVYPKSKYLRYVGVASPLKIASHQVTPEITKIKNGDIRLGLIIMLKNKKFIDIGVNYFFPYYGKNEIGSKIIIKFNEGYPKLIITEVKDKRIQNLYAGYNVKNKKNIYEFLLKWDGDIILTSKMGKIIAKDQLQNYVKSNKNILIVFGTTNKGLYDILRNKIHGISNSKIFNFFPDQGTETIRVEEAILGILTVMNFCKYEK